MCINSREIYAFQSIWEVPTLKAACVHICAFDTFDALPIIVSYTHKRVLQGGHEQSQIYTYQAWADPTPVGG